MAVRELAEVPGLRTRTGVAFWNALWEMGARNGWDASAIAAVMAAESGFRPRAGADVWAPKRTASGLIQFVEGTAKLLGVAPSSTPPSPEAAERAAGVGDAWRTWAILELDEMQQLPLVEQYFKRAFGSKVPARPVDYYLATWGAAPGLPLSTVLAREGEKTYEGNKGLDLDKDGSITVADLDKKIASLLPAQKFVVPPLLGTSRDDDSDEGGSGFGLFAAGLLGVIALKKLRRS